jgi:hypothetical protein
MREGISLKWRQPVLISSVVQYIAVSLEREDVLEGFGF